MSTLTAVLYGALVAYLGGWFLGYWTGNFALLLFTLTSADAFPYTVNPIKPKHDQTIIRGQRAAWAHHDPRPCLIPPDWSGGYTSIFSLQQEEDEKAAVGAM